MAFALLDPSVRLLFGATRPEQISANLGALALAERLTPDERDRLRRHASRLIVCPGSKHASLMPTTRS